MMLSEIISTAIADEPDMRLVQGSPPAAELGSHTRRHRIDAVILSADEDFQEEELLQALRQNPRLCLLVVDGRRDQAIVHHLAPTQDLLVGLADCTLAPAIRAGVALRIERAMPGPPR
jgi:hypothetical protein